MPFAWTGIHLHSILHGASNVEREREKTAERDSGSSDLTMPSSGANSLGTIPINNTILLNIYSTISRQLTGQLVTVLQLIPYLIFNHLLLLIQWFKLSMFYLLAYI